MNVCDCKNFNLHRMQAQDRKLVLIRFYVASECSEEKEEKQQL